jgi:glucose-1-phosphatase
VRRGASAVEALLFDFGGVLVEIDFDLAFTHWARCAGCEPEAVRSRFLMDEAYARHETGALDVAGYFDSLRTRLGIDIPDEDFARGWHAIFVREVPGIIPLLDRLGRQRPLYLFSNTNPSHYEFVSSRFSELLGKFDRIFLSSSLGRRKPEPAAFHAVAQAIDVPPERVLFFDDTPVNVEGALAVGMHAVLVQSFDDIVNALRDCGLPA